MSVRFIIGPAASGRTRYRLEALRALDRKGEPGIFLVPEEFTYSADRKLLEAGDPEDSRRIAMLSCSRLADAG
jgi:ATP-dependent helicase/nuclease subunit B